MPNAVVVDNPMINKMPQLCVVLAIIYVTYLIISIEVQRNRVEKLKHIAELINEGHKKKVKDQAKTTLKTTKEE